MFVLNIPVYLIIQTCLYVKGTLTSRENRVTKGIIDRLEMLPLVVAFKQKLRDVDIHVGVCQNL